MFDKRFIEQFEENVRMYPDKVILRDAETSLTFRQLDDLSGRVYAYLKAQGIGKEDFVMIALPHGVRCCVALIGCIKAGQPCVPVVENVPMERKAFIARDCGVKLEINEKAWTTILSTSPLLGHEEVDEHHPAFAAYTSGSEGIPKGVLLEYGSWTSFVKGFHQNGRPVFEKDDIAVLSFPLQGTLYAVGLLSTLYAGGMFDLVNPSIMADPKAFETYLTERKATVTCIPSSFLAVHHTKTPYLRLVIMSMEVAQPVGSYDYEIVNAFGQSEGPTVCLYFFRGTMEQVPIGQPTDTGNKVFVLDDDNKPVADGKIGELCYENPFTRGYINDPERTAEVYRGGLFHTGDIARINEDGNYVILGRKTDMIKINGNRIEPAEIEAAVKRILGIDWAFAKGFVEPERSFICVYYTADIDIDYAEMREQLLRVLPTYMIPSYFIHIDTVPLLPNGKVDRQAFCAPEVSDYATDYVAPTNELEQRLCDAMQKVLGVELIGINDDFYLLGGDSLRTIRLVGMLNLAGLNVSDVYASRTPARIAEQWLLRQLS